MKGESLVAITCGANMNFDRLRFVAERAEVGEEREALFAVTIPEERGSFRRLCEIVGDAQRHRVQLPHLRRGPTPTSSSAIATRHRAEAAEIRDSLRPQTASPRSTSSPTSWPRSTSATWSAAGAAWRNDERLYRFEFPERPGALIRFLASLHPSWNISLFHYRNQGADYGRILVGIQVPQAEEPALRDFLAALDYPCVDETDNPAYRLFLR